MSLIVLPNYISDEIDRALDAEIEKHPDAAKDREVLRQHLVNHFAETGEVPKFTLERKPEATSTSPYGALSDELEGLIERLNSATGPDRALDLALATALVPDVLVMRQRDDDSGADTYTHWRYTEKIDDALALVERQFPGAWWHIAKGRLKASEPLFGAELLFSDDDSLGHGEAGTAPLAIISALLASLRSLQTGDAK